MTVSFYISMTSGIRGPEAELTQEQSDKVSELVQQLTDEWVGDKPGGLGHLHATNYIVSGLNGLANSVAVDAYGFTRVWENGSSDWRYFKDTVGLWAYLAPIGYAALRKWLDEAEKAHEEYYEKLAKGVNNPT